MWTNTKKLKRAHNKLNKSKCGKCISIDENENLKKMLAANDKLTQDEKYS